MLNFRWVMGLVSRRRVVAYGPLLLADGLLVESGDGRRSQQIAELLQQVPTCSIIAQGYGSSVISSPKTWP